MKGMSDPNHPGLVTDETFMGEALRGARRGLGRTSPNPAVGAVIVSSDGKVLARGWHRAAGRPHAEVEALRALPDPSQARGATLFVTLEPCSTHGRTPPCTGAILRAGITRVVVGATDPNPTHAGRGLTLLRAGGVDVRAGVRADECAALNRPFNRWIVTGRPWVIAKAALSLDGRLARPPGEGQWLTGPAARAHAHRRLRARVDAILVGAGTVRVDNPALTVRHGTRRGVDGEVRQPWRVVLTRSGDLPTGARLFTDEHRARTLVFRDRPLPDVLDELGRRAVTSVLVEGGAEVLGQFFDAGLVDEVFFYFAPLLTGKEGVTAMRSRRLTVLSEVRYHRLGSDVHGAALIVPLASDGGRPHD